MSKSKIQQIHPQAKTKNTSRNQHLKKVDKLSKKFSWAMITVFAISTFTVLGMVANEIQGNLGQAAQDLAGYNTWKVQYGLNATTNDANHNLAGDGITNYNKYALGLALNSVLDGSVIPNTGNSSSGSTSSSGGTSTSGSTSSSSGGSSSSSGGSSTSGTIPEVLEPVTNVTALNLNPSGPTISTSNGSTSSSGGTSTSGSTSSSSGGTTTSGNVAQNTNLGNTNNPSSNASTSMPIPLPTGTNSTSSGGTTITNPTQAGANTTSSATNSTSTSSSGSTTTATTSTTGNSSQVLTSGNSQITNSSTDSTANSSTNPTISTANKTSTVRTGGEINFVLFTLAGISLFTGIYILKGRFTKNSLSVHEGEKTGRS